MDKGAGGSHAYKGSPLHNVKNALITKAQLTIKDPNPGHTVGLESPESVRYHTALPVADGLTQELAKLPIMKPAPIPTGMNKH